MLSQNTMQLTASINQHLQGLLAEFLPKAYNALLVGQIDIQPCTSEIVKIDCPNNGFRVRAYLGGLLQRGSLNKLSCRPFL